MFDDWAHAQIYLSSLVPESASPIDIKKYAVLVLSVDRDMLLPDPITGSHTSLRLDATQRQEINSKSHYLEVDLNRERITDVKDAFGNSIVERFRERQSRQTPVWRFLSYLKPYWPFVVLATTAGLFKFLLPLVFPWMLRHLLDDVVLKAGLDDSIRLSLVLDYILIMAGAVCLWMIAAYFRSVLSAVAGYRMIRDLRVALFDHVQRLSHSFFSKNQSGAIVSRVVNDMSLAQNFVGSALTNVWMDSITLFVLIVVLVSIHPMMALVSLALMPVYIVSLRMIGSRIRLVTKEAQQRLEVLSGASRKKLPGLPL